MILIFYLVGLGGGTLWYLERFLQCIKSDFVADWELQFLAAA
jgi:hypothetical protein